jgi:Mg2+ and Co2+ transporter CorA
MEAMRESWTDARLDDFREETARRFDRVESDIREMRSEIREMRSEMSEGFKEMNAEMNAALRSMQRTMVYGVIALSAAIVTGFGAMAGLLGA